MSNGYENPPTITEHGAGMQAVQVQLWEALPASGGCIELPNTPAFLSAYRRSIASTIAENPQDIFGPPPHELDEYGALFMDPANRILGFVNEAGVVVGAVALIPDDEGVTNQAHILGLFRLKSVDGKGYGSQLMLAALELALELGQNKVTLDVARANRDVALFYNSLGFRPTYMSDHAVSMELRDEAAIVKACTILREAHLRH